MSEKTLHKAVCQYIRMQYPNVLFNSDLAGATKLTMGQAVAMKALRSNRGFPDIMIYEPRGPFHGCFIELKTEGTKILTKGNNYTTPHIAEQADVIALLNNRGYYAGFAIGFEAAKRVIDEYLK
jgi:hypothetical protein